MHEKSILLVAIPVCLLGGLQNLSSSNNSDDGHRYSNLITIWLLTVCTFSMTPLLLKDGLGLASLALSAFFLAAAARAGLLSPGGGGRQNPSTRSPGGSSRRVQPIAKPGPDDAKIRSVAALSLTGCLVLALLSAFARPPANLPDLWALLVSVYACAHFGMFALHFNIVQVKDFIKDSKGAKLKVN